MNEKEKEIKRKLDTWHKEFAMKYKRYPTWSEMVEKSKELRKER